MDNASNLTTAALCVVLLYGIGRGMKRLRRERFRTDIRFIRDDLFDFMWQNGIDYSDPYYKSVRKSLNGLIQLSNFLSLTKFIMVAIWVSSIADSDAIKVSTCPNQALRKHLEKAIATAAGRLVKFLFREGFAGLLLISMAMTIRFLAMAFRSGRASAKADSARLTSESLDSSSPPAKYARSAKRTAGLGKRWTDYEPWVSRGIARFLSTAHELQDGSFSGAHQSVH